MADGFRAWAGHLPSGVVLPDPPAPTGPGGGHGAATLPAAWSQRWAAEPGATILVDRTDVAGGRRRWTAGGFDEASRAAAARLWAAGLRPGDRLVWSTSSSADSLAVHVGALRAGIVVVPLNPASSDREVAHVVGDVSPALFVTDDPDRAGRLAGSAPGTRVAGLDLDIDIEGGVDAGRTRPPLVLDGVDPRAPALICFTSGTTGVPKGAVLSHANLAAASRALVAAWRWSPSDRLVHCLPVFHAHGLGVGVYGTLTAGASAVLLSGFDPAAVSDAVAEDGATLFFGVPTMYHRLAASGRAGALGRLRLCVSGSAPLAPALHRQIADASGQAVLERYGMTETSMLVSNPVEGERRAGTVGFPLPWVDVRLGDGGIEVRGPNVFDGYWQRPAASAEAFVDADDGGNRWFRTGDLGQAEDGYLRILGRSKELIITGGYNVYPAEVEDVLLGHPGVAEVAVNGTPSEEWGEVVTAWIVADGSRPRSPPSRPSRPSGWHRTSGRGSSASWTPCPGTRWGRWSGRSSDELRSAVLARVASVPCASPSAPTRPPR